MKRVLFISVVAFNLILIIGCKSMANDRVELLIKAGFTKVSTNEFHKKQIKVHKLLKMFNCKVTDIKNVQGQQVGENVRVISKKGIYIILNLPKGLYIKNKDIDDKMHCSAEVILD